MSINLWHHTSETMFTSNNTHRESNYFSSLVFSGGEPHVTLHQHQYYKDDAFIDARVVDADEFMTLLVLTDALRRQNPRRAIHLFMPYFPGARQDRAVPGTGNALTAKVYADIINAQKYDSVSIFDPHSDVVPSLLDRCFVLETTKPLAEFWVNIIPRMRGFICPDAGAEKRTHALAKELNVETIIYARKHRDIKTGAIDSFSVGVLPNQSDGYLVVDDICDGGATFIGLAQKIHEKSPNATLGLWVTHGIFSRGTKELFKHYKHIGCTDSFVSKDVLAMEGVCVKALPIYEHWRKIGW